MKREELLTDAMLFFSPNERSITAENGAKYYREDVVLKAMELAGKETPLPPAEGAEDDDEIILGEPDKLNLQWSGYGVLGNCKQRQQPTSEGGNLNLDGINYSDLPIPKPSLYPVEGAEETAQRCPVCGGNGLVANGFYNQTSGYWFTSLISPETCRTCNGTGVILPSYLHAQQIADKMVEERLREELIAYNEWYHTQGTLDVVHNSDEVLIDKYIKHGRNKNR